MQDQQDEALESSEPEIDAEFLSVDSLMNAALEEADEDEVEGDEPDDQEDQDTEGDDAESDEDDADEVLGKLSDVEQKRLNQRMYKLREARRDAESSLEDITSEVTDLQNKLAEYEELSATGPSAGAIRFASMSPQQLENEEDRLHSLVAEMEIYIEEYRQADREGDLDDERFKWTLSGPDGIIAAKSSNESMLRKIPKIQRDAERRSQGREAAQKAHPDLFTAAGRKSVAAVFEEIPGLRLTEDPYGSAAALLAGRKLQKGTKKLKSKKTTKGKSVRQPTRTGAVRHTPNTKIGDEGLLEAVSSHL